MIVKSVVAVVITLTSIQVVSDATGIQILNLFNGLMQTGIFIAAIVIARRYGETTKQGEATKESIERIDTNIADINTKIFELAKGAN